MVRLTRALTVRATRALRVGLGGRDQPQMDKVNLYVPGFDWHSFKHNWSLFPLFVCTVIGSIVAARYTWHTIKPSKDTEEYTEPYVFAFKFFGDNRVPMFPRMSKKKGEPAAEKQE